LNKEIVKKYSNNNYYVASVVIGMSLALLSTAAIQASPANAANTNAANQTGEKAQAGAANVMQQGKSTANQTGEKAQSFMNKIGESLKSFANKTGEELDQTEDEEETQDNESPSTN
jgi:hypothetical protein